MSSVDENRRGYHDAVVVAVVAVVAVAVVVVDRPSLSGIDTVSDVEKVAELLAASGMACSLKRVVDVQSQTMMSILVVYFLSSVGHVVCPSLRR